MDKNTLIQKQQDIYSTDIDGEAVMMNVDTGKYFGMNRVGTRIWELLDTPVTPVGLSDILSKEFEKAPEDVLGRVMLFLEKLDEQKLIQRVT